LYITSAYGGFYTRAFTNKELRACLIKVTTIIIDEISMVSTELLEFISNIFANLYNNAIAFGGINVILVGDLYQLPPVTGQLIFHAAVWRLFYSFFLTTPHCQNDDPRFY